MNYSTLNEAMEAVELPQEIEAMSVYRAFDQVPDGRHKRGVRYRVAAILTLIVLGKLAGMTTPSAIAEWVRMPSRMAQAGVALGTCELSLRLDVQQCPAAAGC